MVIKQELNIIDFLFRKWPGDALSRPSQDFYYCDVGYSVILMELLQGGVVVLGFSLQCISVVSLVHSMLPSLWEE